MESIAGNRLSAAVVALTVVWQLSGAAESWADVLQSSCKSTCGNGAACLRVAKDALAGCPTALAQCLATYTATRSACRAGVDRCRAYCRTCATANAAMLAGCQTAADPAGCAADAVGGFFRCLRDGTIDGCPSGALATPAEIAASPFPDAEAEVLAIEASGRLVAPAATYARIRDDLHLIRASDAEVRGIAVLADPIPDALLVTFDEQGKAAVAAGTYDAWNCANATYGVTSIEEHSYSPFVLLHFAHRFDTAALADVYRRLPDVVHVEPDAVIGDGNDVCASIEGDAYHYIFDAGSGDCPSGCIDHTYFGFATSPAGDLTSLGTWSRGAGPAPAWFTALGACRRWLEEAQFPPG